MIKMKTVFSKIIDREIPCSLVYENSGVIAFLDINPATRGHTLVVPKEPAETMDKLSEPSAAMLGAAIPKICRAILKATGATAYNLLQNNGTEAGMTVPHVHIHIIPRYAESTHEFSWRHDPISQTDADQLADSIREAMES